LLLALAFFSPGTTDAEIFKCVAENGELTFSQTPCREKDSKVTVIKSGSSSSDESADCEHARRFALNTAQQMKSGAGSSTVFDSYGGLGALSKGSVSLISYVYQFRTNDDVSAERVSALATAKCRARAFGDVSCEQLPAAFTNRIGSCDKDEDDDGHSSLDEGHTDVMGVQAMQIQGAGRNPTDSSLQGANASLPESNRKAKATEEEKRLQCRANIKTQIDSINTKMRSGYTQRQGESLKNRRRDLEAKKRDC
jgi:hypothetical protein